MERKTELDIINETVAYYSEDVTRRAVTAGSNCYYFGEDRKMCAVGRCMIEPLLTHRGSVDNIRCTDPKVAGSEFNGRYTDAEFENLLKEEYRGHTRSFWQSLQTLHDLNGSWTSTGLSKDGLTFVEALKAEYDPNRLCIKKSLENL